MPASGAPVTLGQAPLCEASAVIRVQCPTRPGTCVLVADNEDDNDLYLFGAKVKDTQVVAQNSQSKVRLGSDVEIEDIEGLAWIDRDRFLILGSHSRNKNCKQQPERRLLATAQMNGLEAEVTAVSMEGPEISCKTLFGAGPHSDPFVERVCKAIDGAETAADQAGSEEACEDVGAFNAEGITAIPINGGREVWVGLRSPLTADGNAILLRLKSPRSFEFDGVALIDLEGRGIRDLTLGAGWVWGIAGPTADSSSPFRLWRLPIHELAPGREVSVDLLDELPSSSEGLALFGDLGLIVIDGDEGDKKKCESPAKQTSIVLPNR